MYQNIELKEWCLFSVFEKQYLFFFWTALQLNSKQGVYIFSFYVLMNSSVLEIVLQLSLYKYGFMFSSENTNIYEYYCHMKWLYPSFSTFVSSELLCRPFTRLYINPFDILPHFTTLHYYLTYLNLLLPMTNVLINCTTFKDFQIISIYVQHKS